jgi:stage II sporulation protein D
LKKIATEPTIAVGVMTIPAGQVSFTLQGNFVTQAGEASPPGIYQASVSNGQIVFSDYLSREKEVIFSPTREATDSFTVHEVVIGINFHWERKEDQTFQGALKLKVDADGNLLVINLVPLEQYVTSVISSEMSATSNVELLKAHSIISRGWLLAQIRPWRLERQADLSNGAITNNARGEKELIRWYAKEAHTEFDVCADDHCQRYQGSTKATDPRVFATIQATRGQVLTHAETICDARFSKCCGGMVEDYTAAWDNTKLEYLTVLYDGEQFPTEYRLPLSDEDNARAWILGHPPAFCNTQNKEILARILPGFDQETTDFYRWTVKLAQKEIQALLEKKLGIDFGAILKLEPVERAASGRLVKLRIVGEKETLIVGKELEIRRAFSPSHLYSSAFIIEADLAPIPKYFTLHGAGWGHGVGLCQIGAALMAEQGYNHRQILEHYYPGADLHLLYD